MHLSMKKCHDQKQRGLGRLETKCSNGTGPLTAAISPLVSTAHSKRLRKMFCMNPRSAHRRPANEHWLACVYTGDVLLEMQSQKPPQKWTGCSISMELYLNQRKKLQRGLRNLSLKDWNMKTQEGCRCISFRHPLGQMSFTQRILSMCSAGVRLALSELCFLFCPHCTQGPRALAWPGRGAATFPPTEQERRQNASLIPLTGYRPSLPTQDLLTGLLFFHGPCKRCLWFFFKPASEMKQNC